MSDTESTPDATVGNVEGDVNVGGDQQDQPAPTEQPAEDAPGTGDADAPSTGAESDSE